MLNIKDRNSQSVNNLFISGLLTEMDIQPKQTRDGRNYVSGTIKVRVDQEINGKKEENIIPISLFSMEKKSDKVSINPNYNRILGYKDSFTSLAAAEKPENASRITVAANIGENMWVDAQTKELRTNFRISSNFINKARETDEEKASFELSGVVGKITPEFDKDGNETGRIIVKFIIVQFGGKTDIIDLIAADTAKAYIETNWSEGDTVKAVGVINMKQKTVTWTESQGFGEPVKRTRTESSRELIINGGSEGGLEDMFSYDADDIKAALNERQKRIEELKNGANKPAPAPASTPNFGF